MSFIDRIFLKLGYVPEHITRKIGCAWCGETFTWEGKTSDNPAKFCSTRHQKNAREARKKRRESAQTSPKSRKRNPAPAMDLSEVGRCPNPFKITFRTVEEAERVIQRVDPSMHTYRCTCGGLHIGHKKRQK